MKIAVISDIHGNAFALKAVLEHLQDQQFDTLVNLGDIFYGPIAPKATYVLLQQHDIVTISGNQDRQIYEATGTEIDSNPTMQFAMDELDGEPLKWLRSLPSELQLNDDVYLCHGAPGNDLTYLLENVDSGLPEVRSDQQIKGLLNGQKSSVILCGHTHIPRSVVLKSGQYIVNPGSVGLPAYCDDEPIAHKMENYGPHASYVCIEQTDNGWIVQHQKVPYDVEAAVRQCRKLKRNDWVTFLRTGRACI
ncbi:metallophosphoesterase family protein [Desulforhopalus sp. 52FAK]